jgi:hypothetical protein
MSYEEEDTCHMTLAPSPTVAPVEEKDTCHMRRRIHVI